MIKKITSIVLIFSLIIPYHCFALDTDLDRNAFETDEVFGTNPTHQGSNSEDESEIPELLDKYEIEDNKNLQDRTYFVDTIIYYTGVFIWIFSILWVTFVVIDKVLPFLTNRIVLFITRGELENLNLTVMDIICKFAVMSVVGTLFATGWVKIWLSEFFGWLLSR